MSRNIFPRWMNTAVPAAGAGGLVAAGALVAVITYYGTNKHTEVGYTPAQPVPYSHKLHAGKLGIDCRYCHVAVERSAAAGIPPTEICMNCHAKVKTDAPALLPVRESFATGRPVPWKRVHKLPDFVYFNHAVHVRVGVGCVSCHHRIDQMLEVSQAEPLSMGWCLDCHRDPGAHVSTAGASPSAPTGGEAVLFPSFISAASPGGAPSAPLAAPQHCSGCHR